MLKREVREVTEQVFIVTGATCDNCGAGIEPQWGPMRMGHGRDYKAFKDALEITLVARYSGYFDGSDESVILCRACADSLCSIFPCFRAAVDGRRIE
jgi:hypothetical protein